MGFDRHIVRSIAAMILAIIAYVAPTAVEAHEGHVHCGHHGRAVSEAPTASPSATDLASTKPSRVAEVRVTLLAVPRLRVQAGRPTTSLRQVDADRGCCARACGRCCCGSVACCTFGIVGGPASLAVPLFRTAVLIPHDVAGRAGIGPEALRKPPRTLA